MSAVAYAPGEGRRSRIRTSLAEKPSLDIIAERIGKVRKMRGYTVTQVAELVGVAKQTVSQWEHGQCHPSTQKLLEFAEKMHVDVGDLFRAHGLPPASQVIPLVDIATAGAYMAQTAELQEDVRRVPTFRLHPSGSVAFFVKGRSMEPRFRDGDVVTVAPVRGDIPAGRLVLAWIRERDQPAVFRRYTPPPEGKLRGAVLRALNGIDPDIIMSDDDQVLGVMLEHISTRHD